jgi:hypothetical protein
MFPHPITELAFIVIAEYRLKILVIYIVVNPKHKAYKGAQGMLIPTIWAKPLLLGIYVRNTLSYAPVQ